MMDATHPSVPLPATQPQGRLSPALIVALASTGLVMGLVTALVGLSPAVEPWVWLVAYALWIAAVVRARVARPFVTILLASALSGVFTGLVQGTLQTRYIASNPWYAADFAQLDTTGAALTLQFVGFGTMMGILFGVGVGAIGWISWRRGPASTSLHPGRVDRVDRDLCGERAGLGRRRVALRGGARG